MSHALLLDLDDTILRFGSGGEGLWSELAELFAPRVGLEAAHLESGLEQSRSAFWSDEERSRRGRLDMLWARREIVATAFVELSVDADQVARDLADTFTRVREERVAPFPGAIESLRAWRGAGRPLALVTNGSSSFQRAKIERFSLARFFDAIFVEGELGYGKPDGRVFDAALSALGASAADAWMIGDNLRADVAGAQALGIRTVWLDHRGQGLPEPTPAQPDKIVPGLADLVDRL